MGRRSFLNSTCGSKSRGLTLIAVVAVMALVAVVIAGLLFDYAENTRRATLADESTMLAGLKAKIVEFVANNKRLPNLTNISEYQALSKGFTDRLGRTPIYLYSGALDTDDICSTTTSLISMRDCGADAACASPQVTANVPFVLLLPGAAIANTLAVVSQTTTQTASTKITSAEAMTRFSPSLVVGSVVNRNQDIGVYDDVVMLGDFSELRKAAGCLSASQGGIVESGTSVKILNTTLPPALVGALYSTVTVPFVAYGSPGSNYAWTVSGLPSGLRLVPNGNQSYIDSNSALVSAAAAPYSVTVSVTATSPKGNAPIDSVTKTLLVCPYWTPTGVTQAASCPAGYTGGIAQAQVTESCTGTTQWIDTSNTCVAIPPASVEAIFSGANLFAAGVDTSNRNLGISSLTVNGVTVSASDTSGTPKNLSISSIANAIGVIDVGATTGYTVRGTETLNFSFGMARDSASIAFSALGWKVSLYESVTIDFYLGATLKATTTRTACNVTSEAVNDVVAFDDINPGVQFDNFTVSPSGVNTNFYVAGVNACTGSTCQSSVVLATARCP